MSSLKKHKILFLSPYPVNKAPSQRLKYEQYYPFFEEAGFEITTSCFIDENFWEVIYKPGNYLKKIFYTFSGYARRISDLFNIKKYDIVYIHLWVTPLGKPFFEWLFCRAAKKVVYDIDDLIFLGHSSAANKNSQFLKGKDKAIYLVKNADHVITCTPHLDNFVKYYNPNTTDISSTINTEVYRPKQDYSVKEKIVLGWSGSHSTSKFLYLLKDVLLELNRQFDFKLVVVGNSEFKIEGLNLEAKEWQEETEVDDLSKIDIGLYPLPDEPWVYGKSGLKALQYMALGIPTIATAIGANFRVINTGVNGILVKNDDEWKKAITLLVNDIELRKKIGAEARKTVENSFSLHANKDKYINVLQTL